MLKIEEEFPIGAVVTFNIFTNREFYPYNLYDVVGYESHKNGESLLVEYLLVKDKKGIVHQHTRDFICTKQQYELNCLLGIYEQHT